MRCNTRRRLRLQCMQAGCQRCACQAAAAVQVCARQLQRRSPRLCFILKSHNILHAAQRVGSLKPSRSFSSPLLIDLRSSGDGVVAVRVVVRSLGLCRGEDRARAMFDGNRAAADAEGEDVICYAPQTPRLARACVGTVSAVAFEVRSTNVRFMFSSRNSISCRQLPTPTPYKCLPWCWPRWKCS
jgi:hypothetical protein